MLTCWFQTLNLNDLETVGGKNASLGEMISNLSEAGLNVPGGFATTASAYRNFLAYQGLAERINTSLDTLNVDDVVALATTGQKIRDWVMNAPLPANLEDAIRKDYKTLESQSTKNVAVAVRSSATAEDLPDASFAGQQETFLNVRGIDQVLEKVKEVFASLFTDRAIAYRVHHGFDHAEVALSAGIQQMVESECSGVAFTLDTESGYKDAVFITSSYGLGELIVQGAVNPDEFYVHKPSLNAERPAILSKKLGSKLEQMIFSEDANKLVETLSTSAEQRQQFSLTNEEITQLAKYALLIEKHYGRNMDIEWAKDKHSQKLYILQARPETVQSQQNAKVLERYQLLEHGELLLEGRAVGQRIGAGTVRIIKNPSEMDKVQEGDVLVADMTDPDWEPVMKRASAIVTNRGGRTCHAAIIARELGIPAVVGSGSATKLLADGQAVTVSCAEGDTGFIYKGILDFEIQRTKLNEMPPSPTKIMMNVASPERAFNFAQLPNAGVGLARLEFIIANTISIHPKALLDYPHVSAELAGIIEEKTAAYANPKAFFIEKLSEGIATIAAAFAPNPVIVRMSDFKSNEYAHLIGGSDYEPTEENPMIGFRGASRYRDASFTDCFAMECEALKHVRDTMGLSNVKIMIPFVRTVGEAEEVIDLLKVNGLERGKNALELIMMCEVPSNAILADEFLNHFDGFSIGSNDLTQLTLALDRDSGLVANLFSEQDPAVRKLIELAIAACKRQNKYIGICGQGPSDDPEFANWLVEQGIKSISLNPDTVIETWLHLAKQKQLRNTEKNSSLSSLEDTTQEVSLAT